MVRSSKGNIVVLVLIIFGLAASATAFYFYQKSQIPNPSPAVTSNSETSNKPKPITPSTPIDETANWKTFTNSQWKYSFKYPADLRVGGLNMGAAEENLDVLVEAPKMAGSNESYLAQPFLEINVSNDITTNLKSYATSSFNSNRVGNQFNSALERFTNGSLLGWQYSFSGKVFNTTGSDGNTDGRSGFVINYGGKIKVVFLQSGNNIYTIWVADTNPFNQILSTFKFLN